MVLLEFYANLENYELNTLIDPDKVSDGILSHARLLEMEKIGSDADVSEQLCI